MLNRPHPIQPAEQHGDRPRIVPQAMAGPAEQAQFRIAVRVHELACVGDGNTVVLVAVHHEHRSGCETTGRSHGPKPTELARPLVNRRGEPTVANRADFTCVFEESPRVLSPVVEVGARAQETDR